MLSVQGQVPRVVALVPTRSAAGIVIDFVAMHEGVYRVS